MPQIHWCFHISHILVDRIVDQLGNWLDELRAANIADSLEEICTSSTQRFVQSRHGRNERLDHQNIIDGRLGLVDRGFLWYNDKL